MVTESFIGLMEGFLKENLSKIKRIGMGTLTYPDGRKEVGYWENNK